MKFLSPLLGTVDLFFCPFFVVFEVIDRVLCSFVLAEVAQNQPAAAGAFDFASGEERSSQLCFWAGESR